MDKGTDPTGMLTGAKVRAYVLAMLEKYIPTYQGQQHHQRITKNHLRYCRRIIVLPHQRESKAALKTYLTKDQPAILFFGAGNRCLSLIGDLGGLVSLWHIYISV